MNKLPTEKRVQILNMLVEGSSMRSISRVVRVSINTVTKLLIDAGEACAVNTVVRTAPIAIPAYTLIMRIPAGALHP